MTRKRRRIILLSAVALLVLSLGVLLWPSPRLYRVTPLAFRGGRGVAPCVMNDRGQIAGLALTAKGQVHLFLRDRENGMQDLGAVTGDYLAINNAGQIVGTMIDPNGNGHAFLWDPNSGRQLLGMLGGIRSYANAINDRAQVVGTAEMSAGVYHAFLWDRAGGMRDLGPGRACTINNAGQIILSTPAGGVLLNANTAGGGTPIPVRGHLSMNNDGCVVGYSPASAARQEAVMWRRDLSMAKSMRLGAEVIACAINDANQVLLTKEQPARLKIWGRTLVPYRVKCYLYDPTRGLISVDRYIGARRAEDFYPTDLNNEGCIILSSGSGAVLLEPIPGR